jgi:hypothetical protein
MVKIFLNSGLPKTKLQGTKTYTEATLFPILTVDKLLPEVERNRYLNKIQGLTLLSEDFFKATYVDLIDNFISFVQILPETYGEELGGLLNDGLRRGLFVLQILKETQEKPHPLFNFAIFSIALLADMGRILTYRVMISDDKGVFIDEWHPYLGSMLEYGEYFKLRPYEDTPITLVKSATPLLARQLLNETAIAWLSSNNQIFDMWLAFLNKGEEWAGGLAKLLKLDPRYFENHKEEWGLPPLDIKTICPIGTDLAEKFLAWLKNGLQEGTISYNEADSKVHVVKMNELGLSVFLQAPELFQQFLNVYAKIQDWVVVCKQFNALGLTKLSGSDLKFEQFFSESPDVKGAKLGFLSKEKSIGKKLSLAEQSVLSSRVMTSANNLKEGIIVKDAKMLFGAKALPVSQYLRGLEMRWGLDNTLPKIRQPSTKGPALSIPESSKKV